MAARGWILGIAVALAVAFPSSAQSSNPKDIGSGKILVANRKLLDPNFYHSVVFLVIHQNDAVVGLVLNRRSHMSVESVFEVKEAKGRPDPVYRGGPVQPGSTMGLLRADAPPSGARQVASGIQLVAAESVLRKVMASPVEADSFRVFVGYAGWTGPQLRDEVQSGAWYIFPGNAKFVFDNEPQTLWQRLIDRTGGMIAQAIPVPRAAERNPTAGW